LFPRNVIVSKKWLIGVATFDIPFPSRCVSTTNLVIEVGMITFERSLSLLVKYIFYASILILKWKLLGLKQVVSRFALIGNLQCTFSICCNSTTNPAFDAGIVASERYCSGILNDIFYVSILALKRKLLGFKQVVSWHGVDW
jgi:hypothetical protein